MRPKLRNAPVAVTLIDRTNYHLFQPLLYQVATAALTPGDIATPARQMFRDSPSGPTAPRHRHRSGYEAANSVDAERRHSIRLPGAAQARPIAISEKMNGRASHRESSALKMPWKSVDVS